MKTKLHSIAIATSILSGFALGGCTTTPNSTPAPQVAAQSTPKVTASKPRPEPKVSTPAPTSPKPYPKDVCIVSGEDLDSMGGPISQVYKGQEFKFCCKSCVKKFNADPEKFAAQLR